MEGNKKVIEGMLPVTTDKAVYCDNSSNTINDYLKTNTPKTRYNNAVYVPFHGGSKKAYFSMIDDDCVEGSYTLLKPVLDELGIKIGWGVITSTINTTGNMTLEQLYTLRDEGHEILSHTQTHITNYVYDQSLLDEVIGSKNKLLSWGFDVRGIVYPGGSSAPITRNVASEFYDYGVSTVSEVNKTPISQMNIKRVTFGKLWSANNTYEYYKGLVDDIIQNGGWLCFCTHARVDDAAQMQWLKDLVNYMKTNNVYIDTPSKIIRTFGNLIDIEGKYVVTNSGEVYVNGVKQS